VDETYDSPNFEARSMTLGGKYIRRGISLDPKRGSHFESGRHQVNASRTLRRGVIQLRNARSLRGTGFRGA
jgi:hypothetical protein